MDRLTETLSGRLEAVGIRDRQRLARDLARAARREDPAAELASIARRIDEAEARRARRAAAVPTVSYPEALPVSARRDLIREAIRDNQVVIVAGETGSGKTTQLPKICLELGRGVDGMIGHTQPRRIAARTVAERISEELGVALGGAVGYAVRFTDTVSDLTLVKVMTDGILLAEIRRDRMLSAYDTIIVDEAHERSLNIDFLLGYLTHLLPRRPELKVIVTSATIDTERFAKHFGAPVVEVSGRTFPVEVRYRPVQEEGADRDRDPNQAIVDAVGELMADQPGDVLVFLPGERDIRDAADALRAAGPEGLEILPLYARLTAAEQHRAFRPHAGRRVVLATNIAETSLTVPGIRSVVDTGLARISRFSHRTKIQRLPIEAISQASANQRAGRCGRLGPGVCIRLYDEEDFVGRPEFTEPEILRTNLASVILQMAAVGLGEIERFPFLEPPDSRSIADGRALLEELGAFERRDRALVLTKVGRDLAELPVDPRLGRMVLAAKQYGCVREVTIIAAALATGDPRERPAEKAQAADELHRRFAVADSDFMGFVRLWDYLDEIQHELSGNQFRRRCRAEYLNVLRIREWQDVASQIRRVLHAKGVGRNTDAAPAALVHQALLPGLLSQIGMRDRVRNDYQGARNAHWEIGRGSSLGRTRPAWVMAGELVETERTWARTVARIEPSWAERAGAHLVKRSYDEPWWDARRGEAMINERVTLYGLPVVTARPVSLARLDAREAREMFIRHALVEGDWRPELPFLVRNRDRVTRVRSLEARVRRRDLYAGDEAVFSFYDGAIPSEVTNGKRFDRWWRRVGAAQPEQLDVPFGRLLEPDARAIDAGAYPTRWHVGELDLAVGYRWAYGEWDDGVTVEIPLAALNRLPAAPFSWQVPGFRPELIGALISSLSKERRRALAPLSDTVGTVVKAVDPEQGAILPLLAEELSVLAGLRIRPEDFDVGSVPEHLRVHFVVRDAAGLELARGDDVDALRTTLRPDVQALVGEIAPGLVRSGETAWVFGDLPRTVTRGGIVGYPALIDEGETVGVAVLDSQGAQEEAMWSGARRLLLLSAPIPDGHVQRRLSNETKLALARSATPVGVLVERCAAAAADELITSHGGPPFTEEAFAPMALAARSQLVEEVAQLASSAGRILVEVSRVLAKLDALARRGPRTLDSAVADLRRQLGAFLDAAALASMGVARMADVGRYLAAAERRIDALPQDLRRDSERQSVIERVTERYRLWLAARDETSAPAAGTDDPRWMIEELRVSLWAQSLGVPSPVSETRILRRLEER